MANIAHASLTGSEVHEPKGIGSAALGTVYVSNGGGSGSWQNVGTSSFTGMVADFIGPIVPNGWLELNGADINTTTYSALYGAMTITQNGTTISGNNSVTSLTDTSNMRVGYYVFGPGIASGTTITTINSGTQITLSANASSSGTVSVVVSPWLLNTGTIRLPDVSTAGRYRRSRTSSTSVGQVQADAIASHNHTATLSAATTDTAPNHTHSNTLNDPGHSHSVTSFASVGDGGTSSFIPNPSGSTTTGSSTTGISINNAAAGSHSHTVSGTVTVANTGSTETRPISIVVITCVKT